MRKMSFKELNKEAKEAGVTRHEFMRNGIREDVKKLLARWDEPYNNVYDIRAENQAFKDYYGKVWRLLCDIQRLEIEQPQE